jgi:tetratricopeptide (TPR) repeat protein
MPEEVSAQDSAKARAFFERAQKAAEASNFDYAIDMYIEGLHYAPEALEEGHLPLAELARHRQGKGGKKPSMVEKVKHLRGKTPLEQLLNAEYLFTKDPGHLPYAEAMLKTAMEGGYKKTATWIANLIFQTNNVYEKPSVQTYILLKNSYTAMGEFDKALAACQRAARLRPEDGRLAEDFKNLSAELTMARGKYDTEVDFRESIKDRQEQDKLHAQSSVVKTDDYRTSAVEDARKKLAREPYLPMNIFNLADALSDLENDKAENEAIELLENAYKTRDDFSYKQRAGLLRIKQLRRKIREARAALDANPNDGQARMKVEELTIQLNNTELEHYRLCMENYPTDLQAKFEYAVRLARNKRYNEAIPLFQEAQKDPRRKITSMNMMGFCFFMKGWFQDAIDIFTQAIESYEIKEDAIAKELRYNLARAYEEQGDTEKALELYRKLAQLDFAYKDVSQRVDKLRGTKS